MYRLIESFKEGVTHVTCHTSRRGARFTPAPPPRGDGLVCYPDRAFFGVYYAVCYPKIRRRVQILWAFEVVGSMIFEEIGGYPREITLKPLKYTVERCFLCYLEQNILF